MVPQIIQLGFPHMKRQCRRHAKAVTGCGTADRRNAKATAGVAWLRRWQITGNFQRHWHGFSVQTRVYLYTCIDSICIYIYIHTCLHVYIYIYTYTCTLRPLCGYHFSTRRRRRIPKTNCEDRFPKTNCSLKTNSPRRKSFK